VHDALGHAAHQFGLRGLQRQRGRIGIARGDGLFDLADIGADARTAGLVDVGATFDLAGAFLDWGVLAMGVFLSGQLHV